MTEEVRKKSEELGDRWEMTREKCLDYYYEKYEKVYEKELKELQKNMSDIITLSESIINGPFGVSLTIVELATDLSQDAGSIDRHLESFIPSTS